MILKIFYENPSANYYFLHGFYVMRLFIRLSTIAQKSQQSASKWRVLAFYRVAWCFRIKTNLNKIFLIFSYFSTECFRTKTWVLIFAAEKIIPRYKKLMQKKYSISHFQSPILISVSPFPFPILIPHSPFPILHSPFPIPHSPFPIPHFPF